MTSIHDIAEIAQWRTGGSLVRIPPGIDVPLTDRVRRLIDTPAFRRLAQVSQLGLVSLVYPAANHSRQEHSLGVFQAAIEWDGTRLLYTQGKSHSGPPDTAEEEP